MKEEQNTSNEVPIDPNLEVTPDPQALPEETAPTVEPNLVEQPVVENNPFTAPAPVVAEKPRKSKKGLVIGIIIAAVLVVLGGGSALAYNFWYQNPQKVVGDALVNALSAKSASATGHMKIEKTNDYSVDLKLEAKSNQTASEITGELIYKGDGAEYTVKGAGHFTAEGDLYIKFDNVRELVDKLGEQVGPNVDLSAFDDLVTKVNGKWVKFTKEDTGNFSDEYGKAQKCSAEATKLFESNSAAVKEVTELYKKNQFIVIGESLGSKDIKGTGSLGYVIDGDKAKANTFFTNLKDTQIGKKLIECDPSIDFSKIIDEATKENDKTTTKVELWVSRFGHEITELNVNSREKEEDMSGSVVLNPVFNKTSTIEAPKESMTYNELKTEIEKAMVEFYSSFYSSYSYDDSAEDSVLFN